MTKTEKKLLARLNDPIYHGITECDGTREKTAATKLGEKGLVTVKRQHRTIPGGFATDCCGRRHYYSQYDVIEVVITLLDVKTP